jgi:RHS repeat-associated protein
VADSTGTTVWRWDQAEPFGVNVPDENPSGLGVFELPLRLPGQYFDKESGLHYNLFRDYDPQAGRNVQSDPIGLAGGINPYAYAYESPLRFIDPYGLEVFIGGHVAADPVGTATRPDSLHLGLQLQPDNPADFANAPGWTRMPDGSLVSTLGGQPGGDLGFRNFPWGNLRFVRNYPDDFPEHTPVRVRVSPPCGMTDTRFINALIAGATSYRDDRRYNPFPMSIFGTYNSNSFVSGVLRAAGATPPDLALQGKLQAPGYSRPVPLGDNTSCMCRP